MKWGSVTIGLTDSVEVGKTAVSRVGEKELRSQEDNTSTVGSVSLAGAENISIDYP